jgi:hypothetical protein
MILAKINTRERSGSPLKIKEVFRDISIRSRDADSGNRGFRPSL